MTPQEQILPSTDINQVGKLCSKCNLFKSLIDFSNLRGTKDGHAYACKGCQSEYKRSLNFPPPDPSAYFQCAVCGLSKMANEFSRSAQRKSGISAKCKKCTSEKTKKHYAENKESIRNAWRIKVSEIPNYFIDVAFRKHGVSQDWYDKTLAAQHGVCAICSSPDPVGTRFVIDHDHGCCPPQKSCDKCRRGLLCMRCNVWIERLESIPGIAKRATYYLNKYQSTVEPNHDHPIDLFSH